MILLDSDHLTALRYRTGDRATRLSGRLAATTDGPIGTTVVNVEEAMRGWLAAIAKERKPHRQIPAYRELGELFTFFSSFHVALFDQAGADLFVGFSGVRIGARDRKIAAIALAHGALLLTANRQDFEQVPGLRFANWMDP
jgi:tRNA(fMet)-specific endonuclease VapC